MQKPQRYFNVHIHLPNTERSGQSKSMLFWVLHLQQFLSNGKQSWNVKYFVFDYLFHNFYLSWACKYQLRKLKAYENLISMETARGPFYLDVCYSMQYFSYIM